MNLKSSAFKLSVLLFASLAGCTVIDNRGHYIDLDQLTNIQVGVTTKEQVAELLGTPSSVSTFNDKTWLYLSETTRRRAFLSPSVLKSNTTRIEFDEQGKVKLIDSLTESNKQVVSHIRRETPTSGYSHGVLEQIFGNIGRFNGKDPDNDGPGH